MAAAAAAVAADLDSAPEAGAGAGELGEAAAQEELDADGSVEFRQKYERLQQRGEGSFGVVYQARNRETGDIVAVKRLQFDTDSQHSIPAFAIREVSLLQNFEHPNVVLLHEVLMSVNEFYLIFEYVDMDLHRLLRGLRNEERLMPMTDVKQYSQQLINGIHACHVRCVIHRDLKPQNILISPEGLKICDFGLARCFSPSSRAYTHDVITLWYRAPEILLGSKVYGPEVDMWSVGCVCAEMAVNRALFPGDSEIGTIFQIFRICGTPTAETWPRVEELEHWRSRFPQWPPTRLQGLLGWRPELAGDGLDLLNGLLSMYPGQRLTARQAKTNAFVQNAA